MRVTRLSPKPRRRGGHGESTAPRVDYTADYFTDAVEGLLEFCELRNVILVGESIGGSIGLILGARGNQRMARVVALNPCDHGRWGGIGKSSLLNKPSRFAQARVPAWASGLR